MGTSISDLLSQTLQVQLVSRPGRVGRTLESESHYIGLSTSQGQATVSALKTEVEMKKGQAPCFLFPFGSNRETRQVHEKDQLNNWFAAFFESRHHAYCLIHSRCSINIYQTKILYSLCHWVLLMPVTEFTMCLEKVQLCIVKHQKTLKGLSSKTVHFICSKTQQLMLPNSLRVKNAQAASEKLN